MRYFCRRSECTGTVYHEFFEGSFDPERDEMWAEGSVYISDEDFRECGMYRALREVKYGYDPYDCQVISPEEWEELQALAEKQGGCLAEAVREATPWTAAAFEEKGCFTVIGV